MPLLLHFSGVYGALHSAGVLGATSKKKTSSSGSFIFILIILGLGAYLVLGPQRRRRRQAGDMQRQVEPGDEVVTTSGIVGRVETMTDDRVYLTIAPGTTIVVLRASIARRIDPPPPPSGDPMDSWPGSTSDSGDDHPGGGIEPGASS